MKTPSPIPAADPGLRTARWVKRVLDDAYVDPIIGFLLPGIGDIATGLLGASLIVIAWRRRLPAVSIARMLLNLAIDVSLGAIPIFGDIFDLYFRANTRNLALLEARLSPTARRSGSIIDGLILTVAALGFVAALFLPIIVVVKLVGALWMAQPRS